MDYKETIEYLKKKRNRVHPCDVKYYDAAISAIQRVEKTERERDAAIKQLKCAYDAIDKLSNMIDSRIHPNVDCYRYMSRMENLDAILAWDAKSNGVD